jgi:hypothetical protein
VCTIPFGCVIGRRVVQLCYQWASTRDQRGSGRRAAEREDSLLRVCLRAMLAIAAAGIPISLASVVAVPASAAGRQAEAASPAATTYSTAGQLTGVAAASDSSAWAVGYTGAASTGNALMLHWNGREWSRVTEPKALTGPGELSAITVVNARDAWAVGDTGGPAHPRTLILHWNGTAWSAVTSPAPIAGGTLSAVTANAKGGWAVGSISTGPSVPQTSPLIFKLTGTKWSRVDPGFGTGTGVALDGVAVTSSGTTFATGLYTGMISGELARWNGKSWNWVTSFPEQGTYHWLNAIAAGPHGTAFALGVNTAAGGGVISIEWTGHAWTKAPAPSWAGPEAVASAPGGAVWAAGSYSSGSVGRSLVLRWNGRAWTRVPTPATIAQLNGLGFASASYGWAVGGANPYSGTPKTFILHWNGHTWS